MNHYSEVGVVGCTRLENEIVERSNRLAVRKIIERGKGIVQVRFGISEEEA